MTNAQQLIYVSLDLRRSLFVSEATGSMIICSYSSDLLPMMRKKGVNIWCFEELYPNEDLPRTSAQLIGHGRTLKMLRTLPKPLRFLVFKPSRRVKELVEKHGWDLVSPDIDVCRKLEDKIEFTELAKQHGLAIPKLEMVLWNAENIPAHQRKFGKKFVVQGRIGHAGSCTWIVDHGLINGPKERGGIIPGTRVKISEFIEGPTYTVNGYVSPKGKLVISPIFQQLMHVAQWNNYAMGTVGISPVTEMTKRRNDQCPRNTKPLVIGHSVIGHYSEKFHFNELKILLVKLIPLFQNLDYSGFFGLDLMWSGKQWVLIEVNPRFTASVSLQCFIDRVNNRYPLLKYHAEQSEPPEHRFDFLAFVMPADSILSSRAHSTRFARSGQAEVERSRNSQCEISPLVLHRKHLNSVEMTERDGRDDYYGHIILRNTKTASRKLSRTLKSGIYHQEQGAWTLRSRDYDAENLKDDELLLILANKPGTWVESGSDFATIVYRGSAIDQDGKLKDLFFDFDERVIRGYFIREKDLWKDRYAKVMTNSTIIFKNPLPDATNPDAIRKNRSSEVFENEVVKLLGEYGDWYLIEKAGGLRRWLHKDVPLEMGASPEEYQLPGPLSHTADSFFQQWQGKKYVYGGNSEEGIDCSAFVQRYFWEVKGILLPKYSQEQKEACLKMVALDEMKDDDLIFMHSKKKKIPHVGIVRGGMVWHASLEKGVIAETLDEVKKRYVVEEIKRW